MEGGKIQLERYENNRMGNLKLWDVQIHGNLGMYKVRVLADLEDEDLEGAGCSVDLEFMLLIETDALNEIEQKAIAKAEGILKKILSKGDK